MTALPKFGPPEVLRYARRIVEDGGDPDPCELGPYCPRCCALLAKHDLDEVHGVEYPAEVTARRLAGDKSPVVEDMPWVHTRRLFDARKDWEERCGTRAGALGVLDEMIVSLKECKQ